LDTVYDGCIKITGVTTAVPGQYKLNLMVTAVSNLGTNSGSLDGLSSAFGTAPPIYLRLVDATNIVCPPIDSTQTDANGYLPFTGNYDSIAQISGKVFFDVNQNSIYDNGDVVAASRMLDIGADYIAQTNIGGDFTAYVPAGTYVIKPIIETLPHTPDSLVVHADNRGTNYTGNNLALIVTPGHCEGNLAIVAAIIPPRPGFYHDLSLQFHNVVSGGPISQTITLTYNAGEVFVGAVPAPSAIDTVGHTLTWNITNLASATTWQADITFYTNTTVGIGTINNYSAAISNATCNSMNAITTSQDVPVRGSFDPNDKAASPAGEGSGGNIPPLSELTYTIRFQNTGTYQAETVKVMDTLSNFADVKSLKVLAASHNYQVLIKGNAVTL
jgi:flagellar basal body rod protein FlgC